MRIYKDELGYFQILTKDGQKVAQAFKARKDAQKWMAERRAAREAHAKFWDEMLDRQYWPASGGHTESREGILDGESIEKMLNGWASTELREQAFVELRKIREELRVLRMRKTQIDAFAPEEIEEMTYRVLYSDWGAPQREFVRLILEKLIKVIYEEQSGYVSLIIKPLLDIVANAFLPTSQGQADEVPVLRDV